MSNESSSGFWKKLLNFMEVTTVVAFTSGLVLVFIVYIYLAATNS